MGHYIMSIGGETIIGTQKCLCGKKNAYMFTWSIMSIMEQKNIGY